MVDSQTKEHVLVSGATGLVGSAVVEALTAEGYRVTRMVRLKSDGASISWGAGGKSLEDFLSAEPVDVVIHLAGAPIFALWTKAHKKEIRDSRVIGTEKVASALASAS